jgi:CRISPR-associated Csx2 family protein
MPHTLITFIGTGSLDRNNNAKREYRQATYTYNGQEVGCDSFVSSVLYDYLEVDRLILIGTAKSMWEEVYLRFSEKQGLSLDDDYYLHLAGLSESSRFDTPLDSFDLSKVEAVLGEGSHIRLIPYGLNESEQWDIFHVLNEVFQELEEGEEVSLDITHAFRSLPLFSFTAMTYLQDVTTKNVKLSGIYYGMLDVAKEFDGKAPIVNLSLILELQDWIKGAYAFIQYGHADLLSSLVENKHTGDLLMEFSDALRLNYLSRINRSLHKFSALKSKFNKPIEQLVIPQVLKDFTGRLLPAQSKSQSAFQLQLSIWHRERKNYGAAYIVFVESLITWKCEENNTRWNSISAREVAKNSLRQGLKEENEIALIYARCYEIRNNIAHNVKEKKRQLKPNFDQLKTDQERVLSLTKHTK